MTKKTLGERKKKKKREKKKENDEYVYNIWPMRSMRPMRPMRCFVAPTFRPFVSSSPSSIQRFLLILLLIQLKPKHRRLDVLTIFQRGARGVRGARGAVFRDTHLSHHINTITAP